MIAVFLANGFEEIEALAVVDVLRRAELEVVTVGIGSRTIRGSHNIPVVADAMDEDWQPAELEAVVLPGGMPGAENLENSAVVQSAIDAVYAQGGYVCAICAAPFILGHKGLLKGKKAVCFPGYEAELTGAEIQDEAVVVDGHIITAKGAGVALDFGLCIVSCLTTEKKATQLRAAMQCR